jgi:hypothetical protein
VAPSVVEEILTVVFGDNKSRKMQTDGIVPIPKYDPGLQSVNSIARVLHRGAPYVTRLNLNVTCRTRHSSQLQQ